MTAEYFNLPDVGEGLTEAEVVVWHVAVGDIVEINDLIVEIETAKSLVELPSPFAGKVLELCVPVGEIVPVGTPLMSVTVGVEAGAETAEPLPPTSRTPNEPNVAESTPQTTYLPVVGTPVTPVQREEKPLVLVGSGTRDAVARHIHLTAPTQGGEVSVHRPPIARAAGERREPIRGVRKAVASAMTRSAFTAPHATEWVTADVTATMELVRKLRRDRAWAGVRVTPLVLISKALLLAVHSYPTINATWDDERQEIVVKEYVNLGIAAATDRGLLVPNIKNAHELGLRDLAGALEHLVNTARAGHTPPEDMARGTITITNVGAFGVDGATPILNPGESAIVAVGQVRETPWVVGGQIAIRETATLSISFDHRLVDGELGSRVLATVAAILTDPGTALLL